MAKTIPVIYVAGPMTADLSQQWASNCMAGVGPTYRLCRAGYAVHCPLLQGLFLQHDLDYEDIMPLDLEILKRCDYVLMLPGWENSRGAKKEYAFANLMNIPVYLSEHTLVADLDRRYKK